MHDKNYPKFHFRPQSNWINDPNGTIFLDGYYHIFYQYNPSGDYWGNLHWGHTKTKDFLTYEVLPIALEPQKELLEFNCYSGCLAINNEGVPVLIYTSTAEDISKIPNIQKGVICSRDLLTFDTNRKNLITCNMEGLPEINNDWRDPYVFHCKGKTFLIVSATIKEKGIPSVLLFKNKTNDLLQWEFVKVLYSFPPVFEQFECPNFFSLDNTWFLVGSPYREVEYHQGAFDSEKNVFSVERDGLIDYNAQFYATNTLIDDKNRTILIAFIQGFSKNQGWNNCISLPRSLSLDREGNLLQQPVEELKSLRMQKMFSMENQIKELNGVMNIKVPDIIQSEIFLTVSLHTKQKLNLLIKSGTQNVLQILLSPNSVKCGSNLIPIIPYDILEIRIFIDHSIIELFINDGRYCLTKVLETLSSSNNLEIRGVGILRKIDIYKLGNLNIHDLSLVQEPSPR